MTIAKCICVYTYKELGAVPSSFILSLEVKWELGDSI